MHDLSPSAPDGTRISFGRMAQVPFGDRAAADLPPLPHPDAELLDLAGQFIFANKGADRLREFWRDLNFRIGTGLAVADGAARHTEAMQAWDSQRRAASHIARRAAALPATTPAGLIAKAQICRASATGCAKLAKSLANDLLGNPDLRRIVFPAEVI